MSKISLIIQREYLTRIKKKSFVVMTIIGPILFAAMMVLPAWFASMEDTSSKKIAVIDQTQQYANVIKNTEYLSFEWLNSTDTETISSTYQGDGYDAYIIIEQDLLKNPDAVKIYSEAQITFDVKDHVSRNLERYLENEKLNSYRIDGLDAIIKEIHDVRVQVKTIKLGEDGSETESSTELLMAVSFIFAMLIYFFVIMYGVQVMRGVMEEKVNRIVEIIVSSVKPFQLMMGKIIGIALVAITQFLLWVVLTIGIVSAISTVFIGHTGEEIASNSNIEMVQSMTADGAPTASEFEKQFENVLSKALSIDLIGSLFAFLFYFIGGYLLYASLFAAVGAAIDSETDSQQFMMPIMLPLIISIYIAMAVFRNPGGDIAFWFSMVPFTSPIIMMARIPFNPPIWEVILSMTILAATFIFTTWFSGRIYRTGILMYGKKVSYKELWKWFRFAGK